MKKEVENMKDYEGICQNLWEYEGNMTKYVENMKEYVENMKEYVKIRRNKPKI